MANATPTKGPGALSLNSVDGYRQSFHVDASKRLVPNTVPQRDVNEIALSHKIVNE